MSVWLRGVQDSPTVSGRTHGFRKEGGFFIRLGECGGAFFTYVTRFTFLSVLQGWVDLRRDVGTVGETHPDVHYLSFSTNWKDLETDVLEVL